MCVVLIKFASTTIENDLLLSEHYCPKVIVNKEGKAHDLWIAITAQIMEG